MHISQYENNANNYAQKYAEKCNPYLIVWTRLPPPLRPPRLRPLVLPMPLDDSRSESLGVPPASTRRSRPRGGGVAAVAATTAAAVAAAAAAAFPMRRLVRRKSLTGRPRSISPGLSSRPCRYRMVSLHQTTSSSVTRCRHCRRPSASSQGRRRSSAA